VKTISDIEIALTLHDRKRSICADETIINGSKEIRPMREAQSRTAIDHGKMDTRQRAFTTIWKHNRVFRRLVQVCGFREESSDGMA
jgi:hypothetical protein